MRMVIAGVGSLGCLLGAKLESVSTVTLFGHWVEQIAAINQSGLWLTHPDGHQTHHRLTATSNPDCLTGAQVVFVAVKSRSTPAIAELCARYLTHDTLVLTMQNGLNNKLRLVEALGTDKVALAVTSEGANLPRPGSVIHAGHGITYFNNDANLGVSQQDLLLRVFECFVAAGFDSRLVHNADVLVWGKLAVNAAINPLTALLRVPNGFLLNHNSLKEIMACAAGETAAVARAMNISMQFDDPAGEAFRVAEATAANQSSMLQDVIRGVPTEIDVINGAIAQHGREVNVPTPINDRLFELMKIAENSKTDLVASGDVEGLVHLIQG